MTCVLMALDQFIDSSFVAYSCTKRSEEEKERLDKQRVTLLKTLVSAVKISFVTNKAIQKSLSSINCAISSTWIKIDELISLTTSMWNIGAALYNIGHLEEAPKALELCCQTTWAYARLSSCRLSAITEGHIVTEDLPKDTPKDIIAGVFARIANVTDVLHRCGSKAIPGIVVKSLSESLVYSDTSDYHKSYLVLIKLWVKEANHGGKVIFDSARSVVGLWSKMGTLHHCFPGVIFQQQSETLVPLLCSLVDLLAMKGCFELQFELCKLIIMIWKQENLPLEKLFSMLFINGRLNHACCHLPMDQKFVSYVAQHLGVDCYNTIFWRNCFKEDYPSLTMFLQRLWPVEFFSQSCEHSFGNLFGFNASVDEIDKVASSLVSEGPLSNQSTHLAGCMYYDLSERLLSRGQVLQAISYGREALQLRKKLLKKKFKFNLGKFVAVMHELVGDAAEAEVLLRTGKEISCFQGLPIFAVVFTSVLGKLYHKRQLWDAAEGELKHAKDLLAGNDEFISCKTCKLTLQISVDVQAGDLFWNLFEKDSQKQSTDNLSSALGMYQSAVEKLNNSGSAGSCDKLNTSCMLCSKDSIAETKRGACDHGKEPLAAKDGVLPTCTPCLLFSQVPVDQYDELVALKSERENLKSAEIAPPLDVKVRRASRTSLRLAKEQNVAAHAKTRTTLSSKRTAHVKSEKDLAELNSKNDIYWSNELSTGGLVCGKLNRSLDGVDRNRDGICNINIEELWLGTWKCLLLGHQLADQHSEAVLENLITGLQSEFKLEVDPALIKVILGGVASVDELKECVSQLISYRSFFGKGECCGRDRLRAISCQTDAEALVTLKHLCNGIVDELSEPFDRNPVILVLDSDVQGNAGDAPTAEELVLALRNHDLFLYFGHGSASAFEYHNIHLAGYK
ncbi:hypothetical protein ACQ4PT_059254 [Festuca glaucescens]